MAKRDIYPDFPDERHRGRFRLATSRREDITLQQELDDVGKKSIAHILLTKELKQSEPVAGSEQIVRFVKQNCFRH